MTTKWFSGLIFVTVLGLSADQAFAHHHHGGGSYGSYGSSGGSYGSYGSGGGSYGGCGSSGGSWGGGSYGSSGGSYGSYGGGSYGSSGGSWGSYGSSGSSGGSYGSYGSYGGDGGVVYGYASTSAPQTTVVAANDTTQGHVSFNVPSEAIVYLVNQRMTLTGTVRNYIIPGLQPGRLYRYPVRVDLVRDGRLYRAAAELQLQAGQQLSLAFSESAGQSQIVVARN